MAFLRKTKATKVQAVPDATQLQKAKKFVLENIVKAKSGRKCVDGRYLPSQASGKIARPGADGGYVMALEAVNRRKKLGLSPEECFNAVYKAVKKISRSDSELDGNFSLHTDQHTDPKTGVTHGLIGCGHLAKAARRFFSHEYDVRSKDVKKMVAYARHLCEIEEEVELVSLKGSHKESGILIIKSADYTINSSTSDGSQMFFVYDVDRDNDFMEKLVREINIEGLTYKDMKRESDLQLETTLQNLALGLSLFSVEINKKGRAKVEYAGRVESRPLIKRMRNIATTFHPLRMAS